MGWAARANKKPRTPKPPPDVRPRITIYPLDVYTNWASMAPIVQYLAARQRAR